MWSGLVALAVVPALAAQAPAITASDTVFTPGEVTIAPGGSVTLANAGGFHNFRFADGTELPSEPRGPDHADWDNLSRTFTEPDDYSFVCGAHPTTMSGVIRVRAPAATPTPTPTPIPTPTPQPSPPEEPEVRSLRVAAGTFCTRRGPRCARPGVRVRIDLTRPATVTGTLRRRSRAYGRVRFGTVPAGLRTLTFRRNAAGRRLVAGRYTLKITVADRAPQTLRFKVR
jgi:plastocyanin